MNRDSFLVEFELILQQMIEVTKAKNKDYTGDASDPFKNFKAAAMMGVGTVEQGFFTRMTDKMMRIAGFIRGNTLEVKTESAEDTLMDLAVYSVLMICYLRSKKLTVGSASSSLLERKDHPQTTRLGHQYTAE